MFLFSSLCLFVAFPLYLCPDPPSSYKDTGPIGLGFTNMTSFYLNYHIRHYLQIQSTAEGLEVRTSMYKFGGTQLCPLHGAKYATELARGVLCQPRIRLQAWERCLLHALASCFSNSHRPQMHPCWCSSTTPWTGRGVKDGRLSTALSWLLLGTSSWSLPATEWVSSAS